jgi:NADPH:quinone reductase-like Zn-dependent oxidoreductase
MTTGDGRVFELVETSAPIPDVDQAIVAVRATSMNRGELTSRLLVPGHCPGWDVSGTVVRSAVDGSGPPEGTRVAGVVDSGAWAELVAAPTSRLATLPDNVTFEDAATLPLAGLTAEYALRRGGALDGRHVLVTGANGSVSRLVVQLASQAKAKVTALVRNGGYDERLRVLGATDVVTELSDSSAPLGLVVDSIGGRWLNEAIDHCDVNAVVVTYGRTSRRTIDLDPARIYRRGISIVGLNVFLEMENSGASGNDLARLLALLSRGVIDAGIGSVYPWSAASDARRVALDGSIDGKAVLRIGPLAGHS